MPKTIKRDAYTEMQQGIGTRMKWARELVEPNRAEVARILQVDTSTLVKNEDGKRAPSIFTIVQYANRFRVSTDYLLRGQLVGQMDEEMRVKLAALHPELVLPQKSKGAGTGMALAPGKTRQTKRQAPVD